MIDRETHLLVCLGEEGGEVSKEVNKALRFGLNDRVTKDPNGPRGMDGPTNRVKIRDEFIDALGAYQMLVEQGTLKDLDLGQLPFWVLSQMEKKADKIEAYLGYAKRIGALVPGKGEA